MAKTSVVIGSATWVWQVTLKPGYWPRPDCEVAGIDNYSACTINHLEIYMGPFWLALNRGVYGYREWLVDYGWHDERYGGGGDVLGTHFTMVRVAAGAGTVILGEVSTVALLHNRPKLVLRHPVLGAIPPDPEEALWEL